MRGLGCVTPLSLTLGGLALVVVVVGVLLTGGQMFSPGELNGQSNTGVLIGGVETHARIGGDCGTCHAPPWEAGGMAGRCLACHTDVITQLQVPASLHGAMRDGQNCLTCHSEHGGATASLTQLNPTDFDHALLGYALDAHTKTSAGQPFTCADCHLALNQQPRPVGTAAYTTAETTCVDCHQQEDADFMAAHNADFGPTCLGCHDGVDRFKDFDHAQINFPLEGAHATVRCSLCHANARRADDLKGAPTTCVGCHEEPQVHLGKFGTDCASCHSTQTWAGTTFDHSRTAFPLDGDHASAHCASCHSNGIFKGTPTACVSCHAEPQAHLGKFGTDCASCHSTQTWDNATFDHSRTAFPLDGAHVGKQCASCHVNGVFAGTPTACVSCHAEPQVHLGKFGTDCASCHSTQTWDNAMFNHTFPLNHGSRTTLPCVTCHLAAPDYRTYSCYSCHAHNEPEIAAEHREEGIANFTDCVRCHATGREDED